MQAPARSQPGLSQREFLVSPDALGGQCLPHALARFTACPLQQGTRFLPRG
jgi:hypothetical protein